MRTRRFNGWRIHGQQRIRFWLVLASLSSLRLSFVDTRCTGASIPQPCKAPRALMSVFPVDFETRSFGDFYAHLLGRDCRARQRPLCLICLSLLFFAQKANAFVTHIS